MPNTQQELSKRLLAERGGYPVNTKARELKPGPSLMCLAITQGVGAAGAVAVVGGMEIPHGTECVHDNELQSDCVITWTDTEREPITCSVEASVRNLLKGSKGQEPGGVHTSLEASTSRTGEPRRAGPCAPRARRPLSKVPGRATTPLYKFCSYKGREEGTLRKGFSTV